MCVCVCVSVYFRGIAPAGVCYEQLKFTKKQPLPLAYTTNYVKRPLDYVEKRAL